MTRLKGRVRVIAGVFSLMSLFSCMGAAKPPYCTVGVSPAPYWAHHVEILDGYYVGAGQAEPASGGIFLQKQRARRRALSQLIQNIQVTVESHMELTETRKINAAGEASASRTATRRLHVASRLTLNDVTDAGTYLDPATCIVWVRLKIRRALADNLIALKQAKRLYQSSVDEKEATPAQKLRWITEAMARLGDVDFSELPKDAGNKSHLTDLFARRKTQLKQTTNYTTLWLLSGSASLRASLAPAFRTLAETHGATYIDTPCGPAGRCLDLALEYRAENLVWINMSHETFSGFLGMYKGFLRVGVARIEVSSGTLLFSHSEEGQTFAFDEESIEWAKLAEHLLANAAMNKLLK